MSSGGTVCCAPASAAGSTFAPRARNCGSEKIAEDGLRRRHRPCHEYGMSGTCPRPDCNLDAADERKDGGTPWRAIYAGSLAAIGSIRLGSLFLGLRMTVPSSVARQVCDRL
jgi:hypothetical protein